MITGTETKNRNYLHKESWIRHDSKSVLVQTAVHEKTTMELRENVNELILLPLTTDATN